MPSQCAQHGSRSDRNKGNASAIYGTHLGQLIGCHTRSRDKRVNNFLCTNELCMCCVYVCLYKDNQIKLLCEVKVFAVHRER